MNNSYTPSPASSRRRAAPTTRLSPFYQDLASPICSSSSRHHSRLPSSSTTAAEPPPPPIFTLDDRATAGDLSPEHPDHASPSSWTTPFRSFSRSPSLSSPSKPTSFRARLEEASGSGSFDKGKGPGSPVDGVAETGPLIKQSSFDMGFKQVEPSIVQPTFDGGLKRVELRKNDEANGGLDEGEWITVFGFYPSDTNLVLREFEKCGVILKHVTGPRDANWMHILYQLNLAKFRSLWKLHMVMVPGIDRAQVLTSMLPKFLKGRYDSRRALEKNNTQISSSLIIGVKPVDHMQKQILNEKFNQRKPSQNGFMISLPLKTTATRGKTNTTIVNGTRMVGSVAAPAKSILSKALDLVFGI